MHASIHAWYNVCHGACHALPDVQTLHEVVMLPLQRPELFLRGALAKPTKGILLFGPPGVHARACVCWEGVCV
jgi:ATP-dependent 26S proteasome regulatory subunit